MEHLPSYLLSILAFSLSANAIALRARADPEGESQSLPSEGDEESGPDGHLNEPWVVAVAVALAVVVSGVAATIVFIKWRQRRRNQDRGRQKYSRTADELAAAGVQGPPYQHAWKGPYASRSSYTRSPSPPSPAHLAEKALLLSVFAHTQARLPGLPASGFCDSICPLDNALPGGSSGTP